MKKAFKNDRYKKTRGGYSRMLSISCEKCSTHVCLYQKDGPGILRRMYLDRISDSKVTLSKNNFSCPNEHILGVGMIYEQESRPAFRLFAGSVTKKIVKS